MTKQTNRMTHCQKGFTLVEFLIALTIFSIGILGVATMQIVGIQGNATSRWVTDASTRTADQIERFITMNYEDLISDDPDDAGSMFDVSYSVVEDELIKNIKTIYVTVTWNDKGLAKRTRFKYYKADL